jgi:hypothetical protein
MLIILLDIGKSEVRFILSYSINQKNPVTDYGPVRLCE